jgi:hypothetical protein
VQGLRRAVHRFEFLDQWHSHISRRGRKLVYEAKSSTLLRSIIWD